ncbi:MAG: hypothetical protein JXB05_00080 [Myxococcaceae bacterium]|nr:hypothetical protein [Myxococcaceae bacterium]
MAQALPVVTKEENIWVLRLQKQNGKIQEYRCATENQARQLALLLARPEPEAAPAPQV